MHTARAVHLLTLALTLALTLTLTLTRTLTLALSRYPTPNPSPSPNPNQGLWRFYVCALRTPPTCDVDAPGAGAGLTYQAPTRSYHSPRTA